MARVDEVKGQLVLIYVNLKQVILLAEEFDREWNDYLQPTLEQRHALDHVIRAESIILGLSCKKEDYTVTQLEKAIGHLYRAFFDAADWLGLTIRERIDEDLSPYSNSVISTVIPAYYIEYRPLIDRVSTEIADLRGSKNIASALHHDVDEDEDYPEKGRTQEMESEVNKYRDILNELLSVRDKVGKQVPSLAECARKEASEKRSGIAANILIALVMLVLGVILGCLYK